MTTQQVKRTVWEPNISILTMSSVHLALHPFHHNPGRTCSHTDRPCNSDWGISWIKGPLSSQGTFVSSDRFHRASMVTGNWAWKEDFIKWIDLEKETEREGNVGAIVLDKTGRFVETHQELFSGGHYRFRFAQFSGCYWVCYWYIILTWIHLD